MTNEEAIKIISNYEVLPCGYCHQGGEEIEEAFNIAIEALKEKSCKEGKQRMIDYDWQNQSKAVEGLSCMSNMGKENCTFRKEDHLEDGGITHRCTSPFEQYDNIPYGCGCNYGGECWIDRRERRKKLQNRT